MGALIILACLLVAVGMFIAIAAAFGGGDPIMAVIGGILLIVGLTLPALVTDQPSSESNQIYINITTPVPTPTLYLNDRGMVCTPLDASEPPGGYVCLPSTGGGP